MKTNELKVNQMEQVTGGNFLDDAKEVLKKIIKNIPNPFEPKKPELPIKPNPVIASKC